MPGLEHANKTRGPEIVSSHWVLLPLGRNFENKFIQVLLNILRQLGISVAKWYGPNVWQHCLAIPAVTLAIIKAILLYECGQSLCFAPKILVLSATISAILSIAVKQHTSVCTICGLCSRKLFTAWNTSKSPSALTRSKILLSAMNVPVLPAPALQRQRQIP